MKKLCILILLLSFTIPTFAKEWVFPDQGGFSFWIPDRWETEWDHEKKVLSTSNGQDVGFGFFAPRKIKGVKNIMDDLSSEVDFWLDNVRWNKPKFSKVNNLSMMYFTGEGVLFEGALFCKKRTKVVLGAALYRNGGQFFLVVGAVAKKKYRLREDVIQKVANSVKVTDRFRRFVDRRLGFAFMFPKDWRVSEEDDRTTLVSPEGDVLLILSASRKSASFDRVIEDIDAEMSFWFDNIQLGERHRTKANGFHVVYVQGRGTMIPNEFTREKSMSLNVGLVVYQAWNRCVVAFAAVKDSAKEQNITDTYIILHSMHKK